MHLDPGTNKGHKIQSTQVLDATEKEGRGANRLTVVTKANNEWLVLSFLTPVPTQPENKTAFRLKTSEVNTMPTQKIITCDYTNAF